MRAEGHPGTDTPRLPRNERSPICDMHTFGKSTLHGMVMFLGSPAIVARVVEEHPLAQGLKCIHVKVSDLLHLLLGHVETISSNVSVDELGGIATISLRLLSRTQTHQGGEPRAWKLLQHVGQLCRQRTAHRVKQRPQRATIGRVGNIFQRREEMDSLTNAFILRAMFQDLHQRRADE